MTRAIVLGIVCCLGLALLGVRYWDVQVRRGPEHARDVARQSIRRIRLPAVRGRILARGGEALADNGAVYDLTFDLAEMRQGGRRRTREYILDQAEAVGCAIGRLSPLTDDGVQRQLRVAPALPLTVYSDLTPPELARAAEYLPRPPGLRIATRYQRRHPYPGAATHVLGFVGRTRPPDEFLLSRYSYVTPEIRGRDGLEKACDDELAGRPGMRTVRVTTLGYVYQEVGPVVAPEPGADLWLTLDVRAQQVAERLLAGRTGALVVVEVATGAVLAMASAPSYHLETLTARGYAELARDTETRPLVNRALAAGYLPGSIIKPLIGLAALEAGTVAPEADTRTCKGAYTLGDTRIGCWHRRGHGELDLIHAVEQSCNVFFIDTGLATGLERIAPMLVGAGLGRAPAIELPAVGEGLVPTRAWALETWNRDWLAIDTAYLSIGQGAVALSPLQAALYAAAIANGGTVFRPYVVARIVDAAGNDRRITPPLAVSQLPASPGNLAVIRRGMALVVNGEHASAAEARNPAITLAGKTGTAEMGLDDTRYNNTWFIGYGPLEEPRYAIAVLVERGASGGKTAAPLAGQFFTRWLSPPEDAQ